MILLFQPFAIYVMHVGCLPTTGSHTHPSQTERGGEDGEGEHKRHAFFGRLFEGGCLGNIRLYSFSFAILPRWLALPSCSDGSGKVTTACSPSMQRFLSWEGGVCSCGVCASPLPPSVLTVAGRFEEPRSAYFPTGESNAQTHSQRGGSANNGFY